MSLIDKLFGSFSDKELKRIRPIADAVVAMEPEMAAKTDAELQAMTPALKERLAKGESLDDILPTAFAVCRRGLETPYLAELAAGLGTVPCTPSFAMLSTDEVPESIAPYLPDHNAVLLANHGALAWGADLWEAFDRLETVEHTAKIVLNAEALGGGVPLTAEEVARLQSLRGMYRQLREKIR